MIGLVIAITVASSAQVSCLKADSADVVVDRQTLDVKGGKSLEAVSVSHRGNGPEGFSSSSVIVYSANCDVVFQQRYGDTIETRFTLSHLAEQPVLVATAFEPGGSGCGLEDVVIAYGGQLSDDNPDAVLPLSPMGFGHDNMGGFFAGDLGLGRGPGLALWEAIWDDGNHYDPHRYRVTIYRWRNNHLVGPEVTTTKEKYAPSPNEVAKVLGLPADPAPVQRFTDGC